MNYVESKRAHEVCRAAAERRGVSEEHAEWFAEALVRTSMLGIDTHGLRLLPIYLRELDEGRSNPKPVFRVLRRNGGTAAIDADDALGAVAGTYAARLAVELAREHGVGVVTVANSNHFGAASVYGSQIAAEKMVGIVSTSAAARMAPFNGRVPMFGTNPLCFSAPAGASEAFVFDMATSQISYSQIKHYRKLGLPLPGGWALDSSGEPTEEPSNVSALSPLGGYKGQGLAMVVQILSCLLTSMPLDTQLEHLDTGSFKAGRQIGHFLLALDPTRFIDLAHFEQSVANLKVAIRETPAKDGTNVLCPGDPQARCIEQRLQTGIPLGADESSAFGVEELACIELGLLPSGELVGDAA